MKRFLASALILGLVSGTSLVGCGDTSKVETTEKVSTPTGTAEKTVTEKVKTTGDGAANAPTK